MLAVRDPHRSELGMRLVKLRRALKLKQAAVADVAGLSRSTYSRIETGVATPERWQLILIAQALRVSASDLLA